ncbi:CHAD domain-containing protein [Brevibacterium litoralis]|uniref:CHAD domain-containing protein n=1 Tax=Brevibacterium litoralis TaxID=3138935 RepID=UPI0032EDEC39
MSSSTPGTPVDPVVVAAFAGLTAHLRSAVGPALADEDDAVHRMRTGVRRLRNLLAALGDTSETRAVLKEMGDRLGTVRDLEVRIQLTEQILAEAWGGPPDPEEGGTGEKGGAAEGQGASDAEDVAALRNRLLAPAQEEHAEAHADLVRWCRAHLEAVFAHLDDWVIAPPTLPARTPKGLAAREARRALRKARRLDVEAVAAGDGAAIARAHEARKAGRRLRHVAEAFRRPPAEVLGSRARKLATRGSRLQTALGDHRDAVILAAHARDLATGCCGEEAAALSALAEATDRRAEEALRAAPRLVAKLAKSV